MLIKIEIDIMELNRRKTKLLQSKEKHIEEAIVILHEPIKHMDKPVEIKD